MFATLDVAYANRLLDEMTQQATEVVRTAAGDAVLTATRVAYMRYAGQGHEIPVTLPAGKLAAKDTTNLKRRFDAAYRVLYGRTVPNMDVEIMSWSVTVSTRVKRAAKARMLPRKSAPAGAKRRIFEPKLAHWRTAPVHERAALAPGMRIAGPALIVEDQTTVLVTADFDASINSAGHIVLDKRKTKGKQP